MNEVMLERIANMLLLIELTLLWLGIIIGISVWQILKALNARPASPQKEGK